MTTGPLRHWIASAPVLLFAAAVIAFLLGGCSWIPSVAVKKEPMECKVEQAAVEPVTMPPRLTAGARNEDLRARERALEKALEKANQRLAEVPGLVNTNPPKAPEQGIWDRFRGLFK